jgi:hypothetical protein
MLKALCEEFADLPLHETRTATGTYVELVFFSRDLADWSNRLEAHLGSPVHAGRARPSRQVRSVTSEHGGITRGQTLYLTNREDGDVVAMLWPWRDGVHVTLKLWTAPGGGHA